MKLVKLNPANLIMPSYNPPIRIEAPRIKNLLASIEIFGLLYPPLVESDEEHLIEGSRRTTCCVVLGMKEITCLVTNSPVSSNELYETMNTTQRKMGNNELIYVHTHGGKVSDKALAKINEIEALVGRKYLKEMGESYVSPTGIVEMVRRISVHCKEETNNEFKEQAIKWLISLKQSRVVRTAIEHGIAASKLKEAILTNKVLKIK